MNIQHSSRTDQWFTPLDVIAKVHLVLGSIDLDPASSEEANSRVGANSIITASEDGLTSPWLGEKLFINPPGGKLKNQSKTALFWKKLMKHREEGKLSEAIFLAFSLEALQSTQGKGVPSIGEFTFCVPSKRLRFVSPEGSEGAAPAHSNVIVYVPGKLDSTKRFQEVFRSMGCVIHEKE